MKILKIELQNINSLKSDKPIVIDFESDHFRDIGLYAITGSTGAGKTTILDAITIALYHNVPRFNKSHIKAGLEDVVSYGADDALARVTFANDGTRYEAQWGMRLVSKSGKWLTNPKEEVRLKNLDAGKIIAEKKREVQTEIEKITHLSYHQFLRSVMLAQGEFAAFLSAGAKDKGTLLEQITGEEIYKKIGEAINNRIYEERKILENIKSKINNEDLLSDEIRKELLLEQKDLSGKIADLELELKQVGKIINWYKKEGELLISKLHIEKQEEGLEIEKIEKQSILEALRLHEKAEPFTELIGGINRAEKEIEQKKVRFGELTSELKIVVDRIGESAKTVNKDKLFYSEKEGILKEWLPKLEEVAGIDVDIKNTKQSKEKTNKVIKELSGAFLVFQKEISEKEIEKAQQNNLLKGTESFLKKNSDAPEIEKRLTDWNSKLTLRKNHRERVLEESKMVSLKEKELKETNESLMSERQNYNRENKKLVVIKGEVDNAIKLFKAFDLEELLAKQKEKETGKSKWKEIQILSKAYSGFKKEKEGLLVEVGLLEDKRKVLDENLNVSKSEIVKAKKSLVDAETILELERAIQSFDKERKKLEKGKACSLCGSLEHPFVEHYKEIELSKSQSEAGDRKALLAKLEKEEKGIGQNIAITDTRLEGNLAQLKTINKNLTETLGKFNVHNPGCSIGDTEIIEKAIIELDKETTVISKDILETQKLQKQKDRNEKLLKEQNTKVNILQNAISVLKEKAKNLNLSLQQESGELALLTQETEKIESDLKIDFAEFGLLMPLPENTSAFVGLLKTKIFAFQSKSKELVNVKNKISQLIADIENSEKQLQGKEVEKERFQKEATMQNKKLLELTDKRKTILPLEISTEEKRGDLQKDVDIAKQELEKASDLFQKLKTQQATKEKEKENIAKEGSEKSNELKGNLSVLGLEIEKSSFGSRTEIEKALLGYEDKKTYSHIQKQLADKALELATLKTKLDEGFSEQEKEKDFDISNEIAIEKQLVINLSKEQLLKRGGEITKQFELDDQIRDRNKGVLSEIEQQEMVLKKWADLMALLGGSKHAFNTYVQRLTLQNLIHLANVHLFKLNKRYSLKMNKIYKPGEELNFVLIDHYQTSEARPVDTSSGGEKFLISLALALGLSDLASNNVHIGSLFIDEGFGTLDNNSLETVISTLETLQAQGKMIGVISHVENLKERISTQIQVLKKSNGVSEVVVV